ncbi:hypothetical protein [Actinomadura flavalba]|uniref:hypothetical protein n=1 Tax=Actinomadura flavalba TaxID=1120938 RepID=UPI00035C40BA|nr:hypothetical protein [Actinomadura flavalba]
MPDAATRERRPGRARTGRLIGAGALLAAGALAVPAPAAAAPGPAPVAAAATCGDPEFKVWYDSDQYGKYLKVWFQTAKGCPKSKKVGQLTGSVYCKAGKKKNKRVYYATARGNPKVETLIAALPPKSQCSKFLATGTIHYLPSAKEYKDDWAFTWGNYPA